MQSEYGDSSFCTDLPKSMMADEVTLKYMSTTTNDLAKIIEEHGEKLPFVNKQQTQGPPELLRVY